MTSVLGQSRYSSEKYNRSPRGFVTDDNGAVFQLQTFPRKNKANVLKFGKASDYLA